METAAEEQSHIVPDFEVELQDDTFDMNRDDEFDFEIGGDDGLAPTGEAGDADANANLTHHTDRDNAHHDSAYTYQPQEQTVQAPTVDSHDQESGDHGYEALTLEASAFDTIIEADATIEPAQNDGQASPESYDQGANEGHAADGSGFHDQVSYKEPAGDFETVDNAAQIEIEIEQDHDHMDAATSVDYIQEGGDFQDFAQIQVDENEAEVDTDALQEALFSDKAAEDVETSGGYQDEEDDDAQDAEVAADVQADPIGGDGTSASFPNDEPSTEMLDESLDQSNWDAEDDGDRPSRAHPNVTVSYQGQDYFLCAEDPDEDPNTYFLDDVGSIHRPLSQFLESVREVISSEIETGHEVFIKIDGLGLEFGESTAKEFLDQTTLARIIEVNNKLVEQDGGSRSPELYMYLCVRSNPLDRFTQLAKGADEGQGLSNFEKYYDEASADASLSNEEEQIDLNGDVLSDDLTFDEAYDETEEPGGTIQSPDVQQTHNPSRIDEVTQPLLVDASISGAVEIDANEQSELELTASETVAHGLHHTDSDAQSANGGERNSTELDAEAVQEHLENSQGLDLSVLDQAAEGISESWFDGEIGQNQDGQDQDGQGFRDVEPVQELREQSEVPTDPSKKDHEGTDGENSISLRRSACVGPGPCLCDSCYDTSFLDIEGGSDVSSHDPTFSEEEWDTLMTDAQPDNAAANVQAQDPVANAAYDDDYLDLGDNDNDYEQSADHAGAINDNTDGDLYPSRQPSDNSSATATLDGDDNGHGHDTAVNQASTAPSQAASHTEVDAAQPQDDEIDWNHDEDDEIGVATQNPADLSPSSASGKRSREQDEGATGQGDESGTCNRWFLIHSCPADTRPDTKRRRTET